jgi:hypothetical protein
MLDEQTMGAVKEFAKNVAVDAIRAPLENPEVSVAAFDSTLGQVQQVIAPGSSAMYHYTWAAGLGTLSVSNFFMAWHLPPDRKILKGVAVVTGITTGLAAFLNVQKARSK